MRARWRRLTIVGALALGACNDVSQVGNLPQGTPVASAATVGQPFTTDATGVMHTTVRGGADVVLSGVNSQTVPDNTGIPIISWTWEQLSAGAYAVDLVRRTSSVSSFTAPQVTSPTLLTFQLTVATATGASATTQAQVMVEPVRDVNHFLTFPSTQNTFTVSAITSAVLPASAQASFSATVPYTITVTKVVSYTASDGQQYTRVPVGAPAVYDGGWSAALGSGGPNCADARNPQTVIPIPSLNLDDMLYNSSGQSTGMRLSDVMQTSDIDRDPADASIPPALVEAKIQIASTALPADTTAALCVPTPGPPPAQVNVGSSTTMSADELTLASNPSTGGLPPLFDTSASAHAYYATIDPGGSRATLTAWLQVNGFNPNVSGWGADAHALYTNNYDLGLGRDMYMKVGACDSGYSAAPVSQFGAQALSAASAKLLYELIGHCDVAAVVVNYVGVQAAAEHLNAIVAVAMEYSASPANPARFTKFYVFAPDTRTGALQRVTSVDLDHRGQKPVPQSCVVCHGGTPATVAALKAAAPNYPSTGPSGTPPGDVNAGFLPWDLDAFFYSDTDPGFSQKEEDAALKAQYTQSNQLAQLKLLNVSAYLTMLDPPGNQNRFSLERELLEGWYGGQGLPGAYAGSFVPPGWQAGGANDNPVNSATLYSNVFQRGCRMCHIMQPPTPLGADPKTLHCTKAAAPAGPAMGCYWQFANTLNVPPLAALLSSGTMPFARRTSDRFWVQPDGSTNTSGALLQSQFAAIKVPGTVIAQFSFPPSVPLSSLVRLESNTATAAPLGIGSAFMLNATKSDFPEEVSWAVSACTGTVSNPGECQRSLPVVGAASVLGWFIVDDTVTYRITLSLDNSQAVAVNYLAVP